MRGVLTSKFFSVEFIASMHPGSYGLIYMAI